MSALRIDGAAHFGAAAQSSLVAIGNFDGVHLGHQALLRTLATEARARRLVPVVLTFDPHPGQVLGAPANKNLTTLDRKIRLISRVSDELRVVVEPFTLELAQRSPRDFASGLLARDLGAAGVWVGENFRFGHRRAGDLDTLRMLGAELGFEANAHPLIGAGGETYSSSRIRSAVAAGDLQLARAMLGRPHSLSGRVVVGDRRGRQLGFPTANLADIGELFPPHGVYACLIDELDERGSERALGKAVANIGVRPTFNAGLSVEAHLLNFEGDLYGRRLRAHFVASIRPERRFSGLDELRQQIQLDSASGAELLRDAEPDPNAGGAWV